MRFSLRSILLFGASLLTWTPTSARPRASSGVVKRELLSYEERYINSRSYKHPNETVKLVGCKKMKIPTSEIEDFEEHYYTNYHELQRFESHFYDEASQEIRIYFPVENALVEHGGKLIEATGLGEFEIEGLDGDYAVLGRYQTDHVHGVDGNIIKDGVIYLAEKVHPHRQLGNVYVYDFGYKDLHDHDHDLKRRCEDIWCPSLGCVKNHGGENCSNKFGIREGGVRLGAILVWIIMGRGQIAIRRIGQGTFLEVIAVSRLRWGIVIMRCWLLSSKMWMALILRHRGSSMFAV